MKKQWIKSLCGILAGGILAASLGGCGQTAAVYSGNSLISQRKVRPLEAADKYRTFYEIFVYSFRDSNGDGIGDLKGVLEMLDYLNDGDPATDTDLGVTGIWLMPIMPAMTYHKYDVKDYRAIDPAYGTMEDFEELVAECHKRGINIILDLVLNHTSSSHPWFIEASSYLKSLRADEEANPADCRFVDYYRFSKGGRTGYRQLADAGNWYYEAVFWSEMPDLNLYNEDVRAEITEICKFWLDKGVDGFRLDAVKEFVSGNAKENVEILAWLNGMVKEINPDAYLVGEAWTAQTDYARYYASGMDSLFDFAFGDSNGNIVKFVSGAKPASEYAGVLVSEDERYRVQNSSYINAPFYSNHDMNRAAGYYTGGMAAQQTKLSLAMNLTMSGNAFLYYGDEIGMQGSGKDENKRLGMRWTEDAGAAGMCKGPADADRSTAQTYPALDEQMKDENSLYSYCRNAVRIRNQFPSIRKGSTSGAAAFSDGEVSAIVKAYKGERVVLFYNLSGKVKTLDLSAAALDDGTKLKAGMLEATLVSGEKPVTVEGQTLTLPEYSIAVLLVK